MAILLPSNEQYYNFTDACFVVFINDSINAREGVAFFDPMLASKAAGCFAKHAYNGYNRLKSIGSAVFKGDMVYYNSIANMYKKGSGGFFVCPDVISTERFLRGTTLCEKRLAISLFKRGIADARRKPWKRSFRIFLKTIIKETGAQCISKLMIMFKHLSWLFDFSLLGDKVHVKIVSEFITFYKSKSVADLDTSKKLLERFHLAGKLDPFVIVEYWNLFGGFILYKGIKTFKKYHKKIIFNNEGYLYKILQSIGYNSNKKLCCG